MIKTKFITGNNGAGGSSSAAARQLKAQKEGMFDMYQRSSVLSKRHKSSDDLEAVCTLLTSSLMKKENVPLETVPVDESDQLVKNAIVLFLSLYGYRNLSQLPSYVEMSVSFAFKLPLFDEELIFKGFSFRKPSGSGNGITVYLTVPSDIAKVHNYQFKKIVVGILDFFDDYYEGYPGSPARIVFCIPKKAFTTNEQMITVTKAFLYAGFEIVNGYGLQGEAATNYMLLGNSM